MHATQAQLRARFDHGGDSHVDLPREIYVSGRSRVLFLSSIGHGVVCHGDQSGPPVGGAKA